MIGRAVKNAVDGIERQPERIGGDLRAYGFEPLPDRGRTHVDGDFPAGCKNEPRTLFRSGRAAFEITADRGAVVAPVGPLALHGRFCVPVDLRKTTIERAAVVAAVRLRGDIERLDGRQLIRHLAFRDQIPAAELHTIDTELACSDVEQALAEKIGLEAAGSAIGA